MDYQHGDQDDQGVFKIFVHVTWQNGGFIGYLLVAGEQPF